MNAPVASRLRSEAVGGASLSVVVKLRDATTFMTPQEHAEFVRNNPDNVVAESTREFFANASARDIQIFIHHLDFTMRPRHFELARSSVGIRLAEDAEKQTSRLEKQVVDLVGIAAEQKRLAAKLDVMTEQLVGLTRWLKRLTFGLLFLTLVLCLLELGGREFFKKESFNPTQVTPVIDQPVGDTKQSTNR